MVRDKIEHLTHRVRVEFRNPGVVILPRADYRVELVMVGDVVTVQAFRACLEIGRCISIRHAQRMQVRDDLARLSEGEPAIELQSVGRTGNARMFFL